MANNVNNNSGRGISKVVTPEQHAANRKAAQDRKHRGSKKPKTALTLLKKFNPETFEVRTSAAALLTTPHKENVVAAFGKFFTKKNSEDAYNLIWALTFQPEDKHPLLLKTLDLTTEMVTDLPMFLKELAAQYRAYVDPSFMLGPHASNEDDYNDPSFMLAPDDMSTEVKSAFNALYMESSAAALFVHMMCANYLYNNPADHVAHNLNRLGSDAENRIHGGILDMIKAVSMPDKADRYALCDYLKTLTKKIHDLLKAMADAKAAKEKAAEKNASDTAFNSPLANLGKMLTAAGRTLPAASEVPAPKQEPENAKVKVTTLGAVDDTPKSFNYDNVASNPELFAPMVTATAELRELGIDPALILKNLDMVRKFLNQVNQLEGAGFSPCQYADKEVAIAHALDAEAARKDAEKLFS